MSLEARLRKLEQAAPVTPNMPWSGGWSALSDPSKRSPDDAEFWARVEQPRPPIVTDIADIRIAEMHASLATAKSGDKA